MESAPRYSATPALRHFHLRPWHAVSAAPSTLLTTTTRNRQQSTYRSSGTASPRLPLASLDHSAIKSNLTVLPSGHSAVSAHQLPPSLQPSTLSPFSSHPHCATEFAVCTRHTRHTRHTRTPHPSGLPHWLISMRQSHRLVIAALISTTRPWLQQIVDR